jgi:hypothetical protein
MFGKALEGLRAQAVRTCLEIGFRHRLLNERELRTIAELLADSAPYRGLFSHGGISPVVTLRRRVGRGQESRCLYFDTLLSTFRAAFLDFVAS